MKENLHINLVDSKETSGKPPTRLGFAQKVLIAGAVITAIIVIALILWAGAEIFLLVFAGLLLAIFIRGLSDFLCRHTPLSERWAVAAVLFSTIALVAAGVWLLAPSVEKQFDELTRELPVVYESLRQKISQYPIGRRIIELLPSPQQFILGRKQANIFGRVTGLFSTALDVITNLLIIIITSIYFAFNPSIYKEGIIKLIPQSREQRAREIVGTIEITLSRFLKGMSISMITNGTLTFIGLWFLDIPFAIPLAILAGLFAFIPNIGPFIAGTPAVLIALSQGPWQGVYVFFLYLAIQNLDGFIITPLVQQRAVDLPPVLVIASQILLAVIFGFLGLLVAVPLFAVFFVLVKMLYVEDTLNRYVKVRGEEQVKAEP